MKECCRTYLNEQLRGNTVAVDGVYAKYVTSISATIGEVEAALAAEAWDTLDRVAHTVKGNSFAVGDRQMAETAIALRSAAKLQERDQVVQLIADMKALAEQL